MRELSHWEGSALISRADTHVYLTAEISYKWHNDNNTYKTNFSPNKAIAIECFEQLVKRRIITRLNNIEPIEGTFFQKETYEYLSNLVDEFRQILFTTEEDKQPRKDLYFQVDINQIRNTEILFDMLFLGYKYPFENIRMPIEVFHVFIDRLEPRVRINSIHGARRMKIFIAHASEDKEFARQLTEDLTIRGYLAWIDEWEIKVGDSIVQKVNDGIDSTAFMIVIFSKCSVDKPWVKAEINAGFTKELESKSVYLLPVLKEHCDIPPLFLDKKYADFTINYNDGLADLLSAL